MKAGRKNVVLFLGGCLLWGGIQPSAVADASVGDTRDKVRKKAQARPQASAAQKQRARSLFFKGMRLFKKGRYKEAVRAFETSARLVEKAVVVFNLAMSYRAVSDYKQSISAFRRYLRLAGGQVGRKRKKLVEKMIRSMEPKLGRLVLDISPAQAAVLLDGRRLGTAGVKSTLEVNPGKHRLTVKKPGYRDHSQTVTVGSGKAQVVRVQLVAKRPQKGKLTLSATAANAMVRIDGKKPRPLPLSVTLPVGRHRFGVTAPGHRTETFAIEVVAGGRHRKKVQMRAAVSRPPSSGDRSGRIPATGTVRATREQKRRKTEKTAKPFYKTVWFWTLVGAVAAGAAAGGGYWIWHATRDEQKRAFDVEFNLR
jgi:hypothetical protein